MLPQLSPVLHGDLENRGLGAWEWERNVCSEGAFGGTNCQSSQVIRSFPLQRQKHDV